MTTGFENTATPLEQPEVWQFSLRSAFIALTLIAIVFAFVHYALQVRNEARRVSTTHDFKQIVIALQNWENSTSRFPYPVYYTADIYTPLASQKLLNAKPLYSWRFRLMPFLESIPMPPFDQPWNAPENMFWHNIHTPYAHDGWRDGVFNSRDPNSILTTTRVFAITGPGTAFGDGDTEKPQRLQDIDADTILLVEVRNSGVHWMEPGDFDIRTMPKTINVATGKGISSHHAAGFHVAFADGSVWYLKNNVPFEELSKFFTVAGAKEYDRDTVLTPYLH
jgi:Protein of unknown function (DUF1559)